MAAIGRFDQERCQDAAAALTQHAEVDAADLGRLVATLRRAREAQQLSLADIAERTGIDRSSLCRLERHRNTNPTFATLARYARAVGLRMAASAVDPKARVKSSEGTSAR